MTKKKKPVIQEMLDKVNEPTLPGVPANLSSGSSMLNLAISGDIRVAVAPGTYVLFAGESGSGKTFLLLSVLAEACRNSLYDGYSLVFLSSENGAMMDFSRFFGRKASDRIQVKNSEDFPSIEKVYDYLDTLRGQKYIVVIDSFDGFGTESQQGKIEENAKLRAAGKDTKGNFGDGKARVHSDRLKYVVQDLETTGSILFGISQLRDNLDAGTYGPKDIRPGGRALKFYAHVEVWLKNAGRIEKEFRGKKIQVGTYAQCKVHKNRINGKARTVQVSILPEYGVDDLGSVLDWLLEMKFLENPGGRIKAPWIDSDKGYYREEVIRMTEDKNAIGLMLHFAQQCWDEIEKAINTERKPRYDD